MSAAQKRQEILEIKAAIQRKNVDLNSATNAILKVRIVKICVLTLYYTHLFLSSLLATFRDGNRKLEEAARSEGSSLGGIEQRVIDSVMCAITCYFIFMTLLGGIFSSLYSSFSVAFS